VEVRWGVGKSLSILPELLFLVWVINMSLTEESCVFCHYI
jgi:hypothetical protein